MIPAKNNVVAKTFTNIELQLPKGVKVIHADGNGKIRFHIEHGTEQNLLITLQEFLLNYSTHMSEIVREDKNAPTIPPPPGSPDETVTPV